MNTSTILLSFQIAVSLLLVGAILLQSQGSGLGGTWGGGGESYHTKRGVEKTLFGATVFLTIVFFIVSLLTVIIA